MRTTIPAILSIVVASSVAAAQPDEPLPPPPPAPEQNWAPPLPAEPAPAPPPPPATAAPPPQTQAEVAAAEAPQETTTPPPEQLSTKLEVYGFAMLDGGYDFGQIGNPDWQDTLRPTKLPAFNDQFGKGDRTYAGVRQSRFGVKTDTPTPYGDLKTTFEFELFGVGVDEGQTTFRLRHAYGTWHGLRAGQTWSPFMDPDVFPDSLEYWGPPGMVFFRNVQLAYSFWQSGDSDFTVALERPGASADTASISDRFDLENVVPRFPAPDVSADIKLAFGFGYVRLAGILRYMRWDDLAPTPVVEGHVWGGGVNASGNLKLGPALFKLQVAYGTAIENYMNDAGTDVGPKTEQLADTTLIQGVGLPVLGIVAFVDFKWSDLLTSTAGYSLVWLDNSDAQLPDAFHMGQYALANLLLHPVPALMFGPELEWGRRSNFDDGFSVNDWKLQFSVKYNFSHTVGGQ